MDDQLDQQEALEGSIAGSTWRYRAGATAGQIVFFDEDGDEQVLELTGGPILEVRDLEQDGEEVLVRTERFEHTVCRNPGDRRWRVFMTKA